MIGIGFFVEKTDHGLENHDEQGRFLFREVGSLVLAAPLAVNSGGCKLQQIRLAKSIHDTHGIRLIEPILEHPFNFIELGIKGFFKFRLGDRRDSLVAARESSVI